MGCGNQRISIKNKIFVLVMQIKEPKNKGQKIIIKNDDIYITGCVQGSLNTGVATSINNIFVIKSSN